MISIYIKIYEYSKEVSNELYKRGFEKEAFRHVP